MPAGLYKALQLQVVSHPVPCLCAFCLLCSHYKSVCALHKLALHLLLVSWLAAGCYALMRLLVFS